MKSRMMRNKELKSLYGGFGGWALAAVLILAVGIGALVINFNGNDSRIAKTLETLLPLYGILIPLITMNTVTKEVKKGTIQYLDAIPGAGKAMVIGKFQALLIAFSLPFAVIALLPLIFSLYAEVQFLSSYLSIVAFWLLGVALIALGILISAYSENNKVAAAVTFCLIAIDYLLPSAAQMMPEGILPVIMKKLSLFYPFRYYAVNYVDIQAIVVYLVLAVLFMMLAVRRMEQRRVKRGPQYLGLAFTAAALVLCIVAGMLPTSVTVLDQSPSKMITVSENTKEILEDLDEDVEIWYVAKHGEENRTVEMILKRCDELSDHVTVKQVKGSAEEYAAGAVIVRADNNTFVLNSMEMYEHDYSNYTVDLSVKSYFVFEKALMATIQSATSDEVPVFYWVVNHMEMELEKDMENYLLQAGMHLKELNLEADAIPEDAAGIIISSPAFDFTENEVAKLSAYLEQGGNLTLLTDMSGMEMPNLDLLFEEYGVKKLNGLIVEGDPNHMASQEYPYYIIPSYLNHPMLAGMEMTVPTVMAMAHGIQVTGEGKESAVVYPMLLSSEASYMKFGVEISTLEPGENDVAGPFITGITIDDEENGAHINWFASSSMLVSACNEMVGNNDIRIVVESIKQGTELKPVDVEGKLLFSYGMDLGSGSTGKWTLLMIGLPIVFLLVGMLNQARRKQ